MLRRSLARLCEATIEVGGALDRYTGKCFCGTVKYEVEGDPDWVAVEHSTFYRKTHGAFNLPVAAYKPKHFSLHEGEQYLHRKSFESIYKHTCKKCGTHVYDDWLPHHKKVVFPSQLDAFGGHHRLAAPWSRFHPQFHLHYDSALLPVYDGLPKFATIPQEWRGGTGELLAEDYPANSHNTYKTAYSDTTWQNA
ncbi:hypothetical protein DIPPA_00749 [Diplonema papillatum]|nr:hypothetical protein DIPPA_00749 [Diplonema papillatum]